MEKGGGGRGGRGWQARSRRFVPVELDVGGGRVMLWNCSLDVRKRGWVGVFQTKLFATGRSFVVGEEMRRGVWLPSPNGRKKGGGKKGK